MLKTCRNGGKHLLPLSKFEFGKIGIEATSQPASSYII